MRPRREGRGGEAGPPLTGRRIVVTRPAGQADSLIERLNEMGAEVLHVPALRIVPPADVRPLDDALSRLAAFDWVVFTSVNAVRSVVARMQAVGVPRDVWEGVAAAAVGGATERCLLESGVRVRLVPGRTDAQGVVEAMERVGVAGKSVLLPQGRQGRPQLEEGLRRIGANVTRVEAYDTEPARPGPEVLRRLSGQKWDGVTFTSPSTVRNFKAIAEAAGCAATMSPAFCIGDVTAGAAREHGFDVKGVAATSSAEALADAVAAYFR